MCERYNGYENRETWAMDLWLSNDQDLYNAAVSVAKVAVVETDSDDPTVQDRIAGNALKLWWEMITDPDDSPLFVEDILKMVSDIGSVYRVNWDEIGHQFHPRNFS